MQGDLVDLDLMMIILGSNDLIGYLLMQNLLLEGLQHEEVLA